MDNVLYCKRCGEFLAREVDGFICPVCRDKKRRKDEETWKSLLRKKEP